MALVMISAVGARMYQWVDPQSGHTQMAGAPPAWYRSGQPGPRVFVFENGQIIDDTRVAVSEEQRQALREQAFKNAAPVINAAEAASGNATPSEPGADTPAAGGETGTAAATRAAPTSPAVTTTPQNVSPEVLAKLKAALERWDQAHQAGLTIPPPADTPAPAQANPAP